MDTTFATTLIEKLKDTQELDPYIHDGSYELVQKTVEVLAKQSIETLRVEDLEMVYFMTI